MSAAAAVRQKYFEWLPLLKLAITILTPIVIGVVSWLVPTVYGHDKALGIQAEQIKSIQQHAYTEADAKQDRKEMAAAITDATRELRVEMRELRQELINWRTAFRPE